MQQTIKIFKFSCCAESQFDTFFLLKPDVVKKMNFSETQSKMLPTVPLISLNGSL